MNKTIKKLMTLTALTTAGIHVANKFIEYSATQKNLLSTDRGHYFNWKYGRIFYRKDGNGEPLVLIHDLAPNSSGYEWNKVIGNLSKNYTVYTLDLLGCGRSEKPAMNYTGFMYVQLLNDFIKTIVRKKTYVVSTGFSSTFTVMASFMEPANYNKLVLVNPTSPEEFDKLPQNTKSFTKRIFEIPVFGTYLYNIFTRRTSMNLMFNDCSCNNNYCNTKDYLDAYYEAAHLDGGKGRFLYASLYDEYLNMNIRKGIMNNTIPMMIMESYEIADEENLYEQYHFYNENIIQKVIPNTKCLPQIEEPRKTADGMREFFIN